MQLRAVLLTVLVFSAASLVAQPTDELSNEKEKADAELVHDCILSEARSSCPISTNSSLLEKCLYDNVETEYTVHFLLGPLQAVADILQTLPIPSGDHGVQWVVQNRTEWDNSLVQLARGRKDHFDALTLDPVLVPELIASGALMDLQPFITVDRWRQHWPGILGSLRWILAGSGEGAVYTLPLGAAAMALHYRADVLAAHGLAVPRTWEQLLYAVRTVHGKPAGPKGDADSNFYGYCTLPFRDCQADALELMAIWASFVQSMGVGQGAFFEPSTLTPLVHNAGMATAMVIYRFLAGYGPPIGLNATISCNSMYGTVQPLYEAGRCAFQLAPLPTHKRNVRLSPSAAVRHYTRVTNLPGATMVLDRATGQLVSCTPQLCPYATTVPVWPSDSAQQAAILVGIGSDTSLSEHLGSTSGGVALNPDEDHIHAYGSGADLMSSSDYGSYASSSSPSSNSTEDSDASSSDADTATLASAARVLANEAPVLAMSPLSLGISANTEPRMRAYTLRWVRRVMDPEVVRRLVTSPATPLAPFRYEHFGPASFPVWQAEGYSEAAVTDYLDLSYNILTHRNLVSVPLALQRFLTYRSALHTAAFNLSATTVPVGQIMDALMSYLAVTYGPSASGFTTLRLQYLVSIGRGDLLAAPAPPPPPPPPETRYEVGRAARSYGVSKPNVGETVGAAAGTVGPAVLLLLAMYAYKQLMVKRGWGRAPDPDVGPQTTLVVTDIEASTVLWEEIHSLIMDTALNIHHETVRRVNAHWGGYESVTEGDSFTVAFHTAESAVGFSLQVQSELMDQPWPIEVLQHPTCRPVYVITNKRLRHLTARAATRNMAALEPMEMESRRVSSSHFGSQSALQLQPSRALSRVGRRIDVLSGITHHVRRSMSFITRPTSGSAGQLSHPRRVGVASGLVAALMGGGSGIDSGGGGAGAAAGGIGSSTQNALVLAGRTAPGESSTVMLDPTIQYDRDTAQSSRRLFEHFLPFSASMPASRSAAAAALTSSSPAPSLSFGTLSPSNPANAAASAPAASGGVWSSFGGSARPRLPLIQCDSLEHSDTHGGSSGPDLEPAGACTPGSGSGGAGPGAATAQLRVTGLIGGSSRPEGPPGLPRSAHGLRSIPSGQIPSVPEEQPAALQLVRRTQSTATITDGSDAAGAASLGGASTCRGTASGSGMVMTGRGQLRVLATEDVNGLARPPSRLGDAPLPAALRVLEDASGIQPQLSPSGSQRQGQPPPVIPGVGDGGGNISGNFEPISPCGRDQEHSFLRMGLRHRQLCEEEYSGGGGGGSSSGRTLRGWRSWTGVSRDLLRRVHRSFRHMAGGGVGATGHASFSSSRPGGGSGGPGTPREPGDDTDCVTRIAPTAPSAPTLPPPSLAAATATVDALELASRENAGTAGGGGGGGGPGGASWEMESRSSSASQGTPNSSMSYMTSINSILHNPGRRRRRGVAWGAAAANARNRMLYTSPATYGSELRSAWSELPAGIEVDPASVGAVLVYRGFRVRCGIHTGVHSAAEVNRHHSSGRTRYSGPPLMAAKAVSDAADGGMVVASRHTVASCSSAFLASGGLVLWRLGDFMLSSPRLPATLFQLLNSALVLRAALQKPLSRTHMALGLGLLDAPLTAVAVAAIRLSSQTLVHKAPSAVSMEAALVFQALAYQYARLQGGYLAVLGVGRATCIFPDAYRAALWAAQIQSRMLRHPWTSELLAQEDCRQRCILDARGREVIVARGPRVKALVHFGPVSTMLNPLTGKLSYEGGAVDRAMRLLNNIAPTGVVATLEAAASLRRYCPPDNATRATLLPSGTTDSNRVSTMNRRTDVDVVGSVGGGGGGSGVESSCPASQRSSLAAAVSWGDAAAPRVHRSPFDMQARQTRSLVEQCGPFGAVGASGSGNTAMAAAGGANLGGDGATGSGDGSPLPRLQSPGSVPSKCSGGGTGRMRPIVPRRASGPIPAGVAGQDGFPSAAAASSPAWRRGERRASTGRGPPLPRPTSPAIPGTDSANTSGTDGTDGGGGGSRCNSQHGNTVSITGSPFTTALRLNTVGVVTPSSSLNLALAMAARGGRISPGGVGPAGGGAAAAGTASQPALTPAALPSGTGAGGDSLLLLMTASGDIATLTSMMGAGSGILTAGLSQAFVSAGARGESENQTTVSTSNLAGWMARGPSGSHLPDAVAGGVSGVANPRGEPAGMLPRQNSLPHPRPAAGSNVAKVAAGYPGRFSVDQTQRQGGGEGQHGGVTTVAAGPMATGTGGSNAAGIPMTVTQPPTVSAAEQFRLAAAAAGLLRSPGSDSLSAPSKTAVGAGSLTESKPSAAPGASMPMALAGVPSSQEIAAASPSPSRRCYNILVLPAGVPSLPPAALSPSAQPPYELGQSVGSPTQLSDSVEGGGSDTDGGPSPSPAATQAAQLPPPPPGKGLVQRHLRPQQSARDAAGQAATFAALQAAGLGHRRVNQSFTYGQRGNPMMVRPRLQDLLSVSPYASAGTAGGGGVSVTAAGAGPQHSGNCVAGDMGNMSNSQKLSHSRSLDAGISFRGNKGLACGSAGEARGVGQEGSARWGVDGPTSPPSWTGAGNSLWSVAGLGGGVGGAGSIEAMIRGPHSRISRSFTFTTHRRSPLAVSSYAGDPELGTTGTTSGAVTTGRPLSGLSRVLYGAASAIGDVPRDAAVAAAPVSGGVPSDSNRDLAARAGGATLAPPPGPGGTSNTLSAGGRGGGVAALPRASSRKNLLSARGRRGSQQQPGLTSDTAVASGALHAGPGGGNGAVSSTIAPSLPSDYTPHSSNSGTTLAVSHNSAQLRVSTGELRAGNADGRGSGTSTASITVGPAQDTGSVLGSGPSGTGGQISGLLARVRRTMNAARSRSLSRSFLTSIAPSPSPAEASSPTHIATSLRLLLPVIANAPPPALGEIPSSSVGSSRLAPTGMLPSGSSGGAASAVAVGVSRSLRATMPLEKLPTLPEAGLAPLPRELRHFQLRLVPLRLNSRGLIVRSPEGCGAGGSVTSTKADGVRTVTVERATGSEGPTAEAGQQRKRDIARVSECVQVYRVILEPRTRSPALGQSLPSGPSPAQLSLRPETEPGLLNAGAEGNNLAADDTETLPQPQIQSSHSQPPTQPQVSLQLAQAPAHGTSPSAAVVAAGAARGNSFEDANQDVHADLVPQFITGFGNLADPALAEAWPSQPEMSLLAEWKMANVIQLRARLAELEAQEELFEMDAFLFGATR